MKNRIYIPFLALTITICLANFSCQPDELDKMKVKLVLNKKRAQNGDLIKYQLEIKNGPEIFEERFSLDGHLIPKDSIRINGLGMGRHRIEGEVLVGDSVIATKYKTIEITSEIVPRSIDYQIVKRYSHNVDAYTQGLVWHRGELYEGTGQYGESYLAKVNYKNGTYDQKIDLAEDYFGEGITILNNKIYQLTYISQKCFIYDLESFELLNEFEYESREGWGLTTDGTSLIMSDGSHKLTFLDTVNYEISRIVEVYDQRNKLDRLNELEFVSGSVYANIYQSEKIARIELPSGKVTGYLDLKGVLKQEQITKKIDVLNGIAYDPDNDLFYITGKWWPSLFEIKLSN